MKEEIRYWYNSLCVADRNKVMSKAKGRRAKLYCRAINLMMFFFIVTAILTVASAGYVSLGPGYVFQNKVHAHIENAYYAADPYTMRNEIQAAIAGMYELGLDEDLYSNYWYWDHTPDKQMKWQYAHLRSTLTRCDEFIAWAEGNSTQQLNDVYTQKLDAVRGFLKEDGWSDWIANDAYLLREAFIVKMVIEPAYVVTGIVCAAFCMLTIYVGTKSDEDFIRMPRQQGEEEE